MKLIYPVRNVKLSQLFGPSPIDYSRFGLKGHNGIDFAGQIGDEILAAADGTVIHVGYEADGYGHFILIDHGQYVGVYAHLKKILVNVGQRVAQGKQIAEMGNSGNSTGPHLHFGIRPKVYNRNDGYGGYIDPMPLLNRPIISDSSNDMPGPAADSDSDGMVQVICDTANIRLTPDGDLLGTLQRGAVLKLLPEIKITPDRLVRRKAQLETTFWIAEQDGYGTRIIGDV